MKKNIVIVGGGIAGLLSAYLYSRENQFNVHLIEKSDALGGLLKSFDYAEYGKFDYGAHNILESGIEDLDNLLKNLLPEDEWSVSSAINGQKRALTGTYFKGLVQNHTPYIDLRQQKDLSELQISFLKNLEKNKTINFKSAYHYSKSIFGKKITKRYIDPIFKSLYDTSSKEMDYMSMYLTPLTRVGLFDKNIMDDLLCTSKLSKYLAYPDQSNLDAKYFGTKKTYYPKNYGIYRVIDKLKEQLYHQGVKISLNTEVKNITIKDKKITDISTTHETIKNIHHLAFSAGLNPLKKLLHIHLQKNIQFQAPPKTVITNILIDKKLTIGKLSYLYNYDKKFKTFRIDNYINYCDNAKREKGFPISIEMLITDKKIVREKITELAIKELHALKVLKKDTKINFATTEVLEYGFPLLSKNNIQIFDDIREQIQALNISNLTTIGVLSNKNLFFESDIKKDLYLKTMKEING